MLTFDQALLMLKSGEDMRHADWPANAFVRAVKTNGGPQLQRFKGFLSAPYTPTQAELFSQSWSKA